MKLPVMKLNKVIPENALGAEGGKARLRWTRLAHKIF